MAEERWKPAPYPEFADFYEVSDLGRVRRSAPSVQRGGKCRAGRIMSISKNGAYHRGVILHGALGVKQRRLVHRLVALAFLDCPGDPDSLMVNHIDGNPLNNHLSNLEWVTAAENVQHAVRMGLHPSGEAAGRQKLTVKQVERAIWRAADGEAWSEIAHDYDVTPSLIILIVRGKAWAPMQSKPHLQKPLAKARARIGLRQKGKGADTGPSGESHHLAKLQATDIPVIRALRAQRTMVKVIAERFDVNVSTIERVLYGKTWKDVA